MEIWQFPVKILVGPSIYINNVRVRSSVSINPEINLSAANSSGLLPTIMRALAAAAAWLSPPAALQPYLQPPPRPPLAEEPHASWPQFWTTTAASIATFIGLLVFGFILTATCVYCSLQRRRHRCISSS